MSDILTYSAKYFYSIWGIVWFGISFLNTSIYDYYNNEETAKLENFWLRRGIGPNVLIFFTFRWKIDAEEPRKIIMLKRYLNYSSIVFAVLTILCASILVYNFNHQI